MKQIFNYREKFTFSYCYPAIVFIALALITGIYKVGLRYRNFRLLEYPISLYISTVSAVIFIIYACYKFMKTKVVANKYTMIEIADDILILSNNKSERITVAFHDIKEVYCSDDRGNENQLILYKKDKQLFVFNENYFDDPNDFEQFKRLVQQLPASSAK